MCKNSNSCYSFCKIKTDLGTNWSQIFIGWGNLSNSWFGVLGNNKEKCKLFVYMTKAFSPAAVWNDFPLF